jgi:signal transduction histidine kinase/streptogramin lyase
MVIKKLAFPALWLFVTAAAMFSCKNKPADTPPLGGRAFGQPVVTPLNLGTPIKINWNTPKTEQITPVVTHLDIDQLPARSYDTTAGISYTKSTERDLDPDSLPSKPLDIEKVPSKKLKLQLYVQPPPRFIRSVLPHVKYPDIYELNANDGIKGTIYNILKDHYGFTWILTGRALYRYDGEGLYQYLALTVDFSGIKSIMEDDKGRIWIVGDDETDILDYHKSILTKVNFSYDINPASDGIRFSIETKNKKIWLVLDSGNIIIVDPLSSTYRLLDAARGLKQVEVLNAAEDQKGRIWLSTVGKGIEIIDPYRKSITFLTKQQGIISDIITCLAINNKSLCIGFFAKNAQINIIDLQQHKIQQINLPAICGRLIRGISFIKQQPWFATDSGEFVIDTGKRLIRQVFPKFTLLPHFRNNAYEDDNGQQWLASVNTVNIITKNVLVRSHIGDALTTSSVEDSQGNYWDATPINGIYIINPNKKLIRHLGSVNNFLASGIQGIIMIYRKIYICTNIGLCIFDPLGNTLTCIPTKSIVTGVVQDDKERLWISAMGNLVVYDQHNYKITYFTKSQGIKLDNFSSIFIDNKGNIWNADQNGKIVIIAPGGLTARSLNNSIGDNPFPKIFFQDKWNNVWMNSDSKVFAADLDHNKLYTFSPNYGSGNILNLLGDSDHIYATDFNGVNVITLPAGSFKSGNVWRSDHYNINRVNTNVYASDALSANGDYLWGDNGITVLDLSAKDKLQPKTYITGIAIGDENTSFHSRFIAGQDTVWQQDGKTYITGDKKASGLMDDDHGLTYSRVTGPYNMPVDLKIAYNKNYLHFSYASTGKIDPDSALYQYILTGYDKSWSGPATATTSKLYFRLAPGRYTFKVSRFYNNVWGVPSEITFVVEPPWWERWWAFVLYAVLFAGTVWCFVYYRSHQLIKTNRLLEYKVQKRTDEVLQQKEEISAQRDHLQDIVRELKQAQQQLIQTEKMASLGELTAGIAHEIQNPLNFINNFSEVNTELIGEMEQEINEGELAEVKIIAANIRANQQKISQHGKRADFIVKGMLQHSRTSTGEKQETNINILADEFLKLSYHGLRAKDKNFNAELITHFDESLPKAIIVQQDIGRVLLNLFNNAFYAVNQKQKTAGADYKPEVTVSTSIEKNNLVIKVKDNGNGIPDAIKDKIMQPFFTTKPTGEGTGLGLSLSYDIVVKGHSGKVNVESEEGQGSVFAISLPV